MTHSEIASLKNYNLLIDNDLGNFKSSKLFTFKIQPQIKLLILVVLSCSANSICGQSPQFSPRQAQIQSKTHLTKAAWFLKLPQFNKDSAEIYFDKAINVLNKNEPKHFQALSEAYFKLHFHFCRSNFTPKVDEALAKARYYFDKIPNKSEATKLLEYNILFYESFNNFSLGKQTEANILMIKAFSWMQEQKSPEMQAKFMYDKGYLYAKIRSNTNSDAVKLAYNFSLQSLKLYEATNAPNKNEMLFRVYISLCWYQNSFGAADSCDYYFDKQLVLLPQLNDPFRVCFGIISC